MKTAAEYDEQWENCRSVEQMNVVFCRLIRSYSAMEDRLRAAEIIIGGVAEKIAAYRKRK